MNATQSPTYICRTCNKELSSAGEVDGPITYFHAGPADHPAVPLLRHYDVKASDLRNGDLMRLGSSTNYVLVADANTDSAGQIAVTIYNGTTPNSKPTIRLNATDDVSLSMRNAKP